MDPTHGRRYDLARLRTVVGIGQVLAHYGLDTGLRPSGGALVGYCPLPGHAGDRSNRSAFRVSVRRGLWCCFTHCGGGDVVRLVAQFEDGDWARTARVLASIEQQAPAHRRLSLVDVVAGFQPYTRQLGLDPGHPFLGSRGIRAQTARLFEAGWWPLGGMLEGCVAVRLHDPDGSPLGYAGRRVDDRLVELRSKWCFPPALPKADLLFGWHRAWPHAAGRGMIVVEGPWDAMRVHQAGFPNVVALCGTSLSPAQRALLLQVPPLLLLFDGDHAGRRAARTVASTLDPAPVHIIDLPDGADPADLPDDNAVRATLRPRLPRPPTQTP